MDNKTLIIKTLMIFLLGNLTLVQAQNHTVKTIFGQQIQRLNTSNGLVRCASDEYENYLRSIHPERTSTEAFEQWIAPKVEEMKSSMLAQRNVNTVITIPVVVHVIHSGQSVGTGRNISDSRVLSQITVLNQDFRRMLGTNGYNQNAVGADVEIEFCMAQRKPDGTATNGINRVNLGNTTWNESNVESILKPQTQWDPTQYFNIWVCQFGGDLNGVLGYAQFPSNSGLGGLDTNGGSATTDGVIIDYRCFGSNEIAPNQGTYLTDYNLGRTATHEIGHCFGLRHIWGDTTSCTVNTTDSFKDYCPDTPAASEANYDCLSSYDSCPNASGVDMVENYMDYTNDACMNIFTLNQKARILAVMQNSPRRSTLATSQGCQAPLRTSYIEYFDTLRLYPNPANNYVIIDSGTVTELPDHYEVITTLGQKLQSVSVNSSSDLTLNTSSLANGVYFIRVYKGANSKTLRLIKE